MKYLPIILLILICSCNNANQKTQSVPIDTTENDSEDEVYTPSIHKDNVNIDSIINNSGYKLKGTIGCILWDSTEFNGIGTATSPFHLPSAKHPTVHVNSKGIINSIMGEGGGVGAYLYLPNDKAYTVKMIDIDSISFQSWHIGTLPVKAKWLWRTYPDYLDSSFNKD